MCEQLVKIAISRFWILCQKFHVNFVENKINDWTDGVWRYFYPDPFYVGRAMCEICKKNDRRISTTCEKSTEAMENHLRGTFHHLKLIRMKSPTEDHRMYKVIK